LPPPEVRKHDGFYFRFGTGLGGYLETLTPPNGPLAARASGIGGTVELAIGGTPFAGLVLGGGLYMERILASDVERSDSRLEPLPNALQPSFRDTTLLGPMLDYYPDPHDGLHFQAAAGLFYMARPGYTPGDFSSREYSALGVGAMVGLGQEWWVTDQSSIGVTTQVLAATAEGRTQDGESWRHVIVATPTFVFTWTYH
jgi:hypothetical protein